MDTAVLTEIENLRRATLAELRAKFQQVFHEPTQSRHRQHLFRLIAWRHVRSDIFSFGVTLYEVLTGKRPFQGNLPPALRMPVEKALEKNPADRYQTMGDLAVDLRRTLRQSATGELSPARDRKPTAWIAAVTLLSLVALARDW